MTLRCPAPAPRRPLGPSAPAGLALALASLLALSCSRPPTSPQAGSQAKARPPIAEATAPDPRGDCSLKGLSGPLISASDAQWGSGLAPVVIVLFSDFECPFCAMGRESLDEVRARYGPDKLRVVWKHAPLRMHRMARPAAEASEAVKSLAGPAAFWRFHDAIFSHQADLSPESLRQWAGQSGVADLAAFDRIAAGPEVKAKVEQDIRVATEIGIRATPSMVINGSLVEGAVPAEELSSLIDAELGKPGAQQQGHACARLKEGWSPEPPASPPKG